MAQVYTFTDLNGEVRLMAEINPAPGGALPDPITVPVEIAPTDPAPAGNNFLKVTAPVGTQSAGPYLVEVEDENGLDQMTLDSYGNLTITAPAGSGNVGAVTLAQREPHGGNVRLRTVPAGGGGNLDVVGGDTQTDPLLSLADNATTPQFVVYPDGKVLANLPTANPHVAGQLWANAGIVTVSAGP